MHIITAKPTKNKSAKSLTIILCTLIIFIPASNEPSDCWQTLDDCHESQIPFYPIH